MELNLTKSETKIVELKAKGFLAKQICDKLFVTVHTVKQHTKNALKRNNLSNGFELVARYAATHPELFRNLIVVFFLSIQSLICFSNPDIDLRRSRRTENRIVRVRKQS